jgi:hypothetical protein
MFYRYLRAVILLTLVSVAEGAFPTAQIQHSWPLRLGGEIGANFFRPTGLMLAAGPFVTVSAGRDGLGLNAGLKGSLFQFLPFATAGIGASGLYLWEGDDATYAGARGSVSFSLLTVFGGAYKRLSGDQRDDWLFSLGAGIGLP